MKRKISSVTSRTQGEGARRGSDRKPALELAGKREAGMKSNDLAR